MKNKYSFSEFISNCLAFLVTKLFYRPARLIRRPVYVRGKKSISMGKGLTTGHSCRFDLDGMKKTLFVGDNCEFGDNTHIVALNSVIIGNNVLIASKVFITDTNHGNYKGEKQDSPNTLPKDRPLVKSNIHIGNNVWIGENAVILPGTSIGDGCVVGANTIVKGKFDSNCMIAGCPARIIKKWDPSLEKWIKND